MSGTSVSREVKPWIGHAVDLRLTTWPMVEISIEANFTLRPAVYEALLEHVGAIEALLRGEVPREGPEYDPEGPQLFSELDEDEEQP